MRWRSCQMRLSDREDRVDLHVASPDNSTRLGTATTGRPGGRAVSRSGSTSERPGPDSDGCRHRESSQVAVFFVLSTPVAVFMVRPGERLAVEPDRAGLAQLQSPTLSAFASLRTLGPGRKEQRGLPLAQGVLTPLLVGQWRDPDGRHVFNTKERRPRTQGKFRVGQSSSAARLATALRSQATSVTCPKQRWPAKAWINTASALFDSPR